MTPGQKHPLLRYPLWVHIPYVVVLMIPVVTALAARPWPATVPMHFGFNGRADAWGSPGTQFTLTVVTGSGLLLLLMTIAEVWARTERTKRFNWIELVHALPIGLLSAVLWAAWEVAAVQGDRFTFPLFRALLLVVGSAAATATLEWLRRPTLKDQAGLASDGLVIAGPHEDVLQKIRAGERWVWWDEQPSLWLASVVGVPGLVLLAVGVWVAPSPLSLALLPAGLLLLGCAAMSTSLRVTVNGEWLYVRGGVIRMRLLKLAVTQIQSALSDTFSPLADFGGWGIRFGRGGLGYIYNGNRGVRITTHAGKRYTIGSDRPDELAAVLQAAIAARESGSSPASA